MINQVLYIDDDVTAQLIFRLASNKAAFATEVHTATNGQQALDYYQQLAEEQGNQSYPHLVLLDLDMPVMGGWEFLDNFMQTYYVQFPDTRVFIVSSTINPEDKQKAAQYACVLDFVSKPITSELLVTLSHRIEKQ
ncbi:response regulator [Telluribacter sp. SYSU D00476]|uniref:response regulator n=1 Tax=Telluribacter sp. SYSU D00476 TaxID=2811430 RepID=UPI001FF69711|nr:response regulator [Telluribacter sp. SYSU D00476]